MRHFPRNNAIRSGNVAYTYASSTSSVATVTAAGVVTAVAPGTTTITVTAAGTGTGFSAATLTTAATVTVSERAPGLTSLQVAPATATLAIGGTQAITASAQGPRASAATISYGTSAPAIATVSSTGVITAVAAGTATITVTAQSEQEGAFAASSITGLVSVTVTPAAQVIINSLTQAGSTVDINNVAGQFEVNLSVQPNGQNVASVEAWVCEQGETVPACAARSGTPAAQQTFGGSGAQAGSVQLYINSAEFSTPNFTTGADAATLYKNGLKTIVATVTTSGTLPVASNNLSAVNFNNADGWTIQWNQPTNKATDANGITWYGGPSANGGDGSFTVVPVLYTPNRTITSVELNVTGLTCADGVNLGNVKLSTRPFAAQYGSGTASATYLQCGTVSPANNTGGTVSSTAGYVPTVVASVDNNNAAGPSASGGTATAATSIFTPLTQTGSVAVANAGRYRQSLAYRPTTIYIPGDYDAPAISSFVAFGGNSTADLGWANGTAPMVRYNTLGAATTYLSTDAGVGPVGTSDAQKNVTFYICNSPAAIPDSTNAVAQTTCSTTNAVATGTMTSTIGSMGVTESANLTNGAYFAVASEDDRLGNRRSTRPFSWSSSTGSVRRVYPAAANVASGHQNFRFGVDLTPPAIVAIPNSGTGSIATMPRTDRDSIFSTTTSEFAVRFNDTRSGFPTCVAGTNAVTCNAGDAVGGSFQIVRRTPTTGVPAIYSNDALVENLNNASTSSVRARNAAINAYTYANDASIREFKVSIFGEAARNTLTSGAPVIAPGTATDGYFTFSGTIADRAGNSVTLPSRSVAIDRVAPTATAITQPLQYTGGATAAFGVSGSDDLEVVSGDLGLTYAIGTIRFHRVPSVTATTALGFWHNPFAAVSDNKLTAQVGPNFTLGATQIATPIPFLSHIVQTAAGTVTGAAAYGAATKPLSVNARLFDIRSTSSRDFTVDLGMSAPVSASITAALVPNTTKNWQTDLGASATWQLFSSTGSSAEYRVTTNSSVTNPPFARVHIIRENTVTGQWDYLGDATYAGVLDQGANRYFRYTFTFAGQSQGQYSLAALADNDNLIAIGTDANGVGLATQAATIGLPPAIVSGTVVTNGAIAAIANGGANQDITVGVSANTNNANIIYSCSSNSSFVTATMIDATTCRLSPAGVVSAAASPVSVGITFTAVGSRTNYITTTISKTVLVLRTN
jgi:hypothetical protein